MRARTAKTLLVWIGAIFLGSMLLMALAGDDEARRELPAQVAAWGTIAALFFAGWWLKVRPRRELHQGEARSLGFTSAPGDPLGFLDRRFLFLRTLASVREVENTSWGTWQGMDVAVFDYWFARSSEPNRDDYEYYTGVVAPVPADWPAVAVLPERLESRLADAALMRDVELELERFNRAFEVRTQDRRFASALLDGRMMRWLLSLPGGSGFEIETGQLLLHTPRRLDRDIEGALETMASFLDRIPPVIRSLYGPTCHETTVVTASMRSSGVTWSERDDRRYSPRG